MRRGLYLWPTCSLQGTLLLLVSCLIQCMLYYMQLAGEVVIVQMAACKPPPFLLLPHLQICMATLWLHMKTTRACLAPQLHH
jgi:hypothetical protein